ncbi:MAG: YigZ family protein [Candidatus Marinimicrobia bacterium]|nr:YigZ family protein [Candidatus Neomarinimicrobiota bacterium]
MKYYTIKNTQQFKFIEKGSKFIGNVFHVKSIDKIDEILDKMRKKHHSANHNCYAYRIGIKDNDNFRYNDDGEPSGSAGKPIYNEFLKHNISDVLLIVTRYFGGKKLGIGGLIKAYGYCAEHTLALSKKKKIVFGQKIYFKCSYTQHPLLLKEFNKINIIKLDQNFKKNISIVLEVNFGEEEIIIENVKNATSGEVVGECIE